MARCLSAIAHATEGRLVGADAEFGVVGTDTRTLPAGALFVAIQGERFDGNEFVRAAAERGAAGALVSRLQDLPLPQIEVADTRQAFGRMARAWRENFAIPVVAVTGSAGKTTVKELIAAILSAGRKVCVTEGNLNNDIGVPLSLMRLDAADEAMVVELGANHAGEILNLGQLVEPTVAVITNAGAAHLEGFGSLEGVARAKGELIDCLAADGTAILNADDRFFGEWCRRAGERRIASFGCSPGSDYGLGGEVVETPAGSRFTVRAPGGRRLEIVLPLIGRANVVNALAAIAAAEAAGASEADVVRGLAGVHPVKGRMSRLAGREGSVVIDDSYNANPSAARVALDYLANAVADDGSAAARPGAAQRIFVLGDMLELGAEAHTLHREIGAYARGRCDRLVAVGTLAAEAARAFGEGAQHFDDVDAAAAAVRTLLGPGTVVLVKASRSMGLERIVQQLTAGKPAVEAGGARC